MEKYEVKELDREKLKSLSGIEAILYLCELSTDFRVKTTNFANDFNELMESFATMVNLSNPGLSMKYSFGSNTHYWRVRRQDKTLYINDKVATFFVREYQTSISINLDEEGLEELIDEVEDFDKFGFLTTGNEFTVTKGYRVFSTTIDDFKTLHEILMILSSKFDKLIIKK